MFLDRGRRIFDALCGEGRGDAAERALATRGSGFGTTGEDVLAVRLPACRLLFEGAVAIL